MFKDFSMICDWKSQSLLFGSRTSGAISSDPEIRGNSSTEHGELIDGRVGLSLAVGSKAYGLASFLVVHFFGKLRMTFWFARFWCQFSEGSFFLDEDAERAWSQAGGRFVSVRPWRTADSGDVRHQCWSHSFAALRKDLSSDVQRGLTLQMGYRINRPSRLKNLKMFKGRRHKPQGHCWTPSSTYCRQWSWASIMSAIWVNLSDQSRLMTFFDLWPSETKDYLTRFFAVEALVIVYEKGHNKKNDLPLLIKTSYLDMKTMKNSEVSEVPEVFKAPETWMDSKQSVVGPEEKPNKTFIYCFKYCLNCFWIFQTFF